MRKSFTIFNHKITIKPATDQPAVKVKKVRILSPTDRTEQRLRRMLGDHYNLMYDHAYWRIAKNLSLTREEVKDVCYGKETPNHQFIREYIATVLGVTVEAIFPKVRHIDTHGVA